MNRITILIICILVVLLVIIYIGLSFLKLRIKNTLDKEDISVETIFKYDQIKHMFRTGDIILFACDHFTNIKERLFYTCRTLSIGCNYGHVALVFRYNNKLYLLECCDYDQPGYKHCVYVNANGKNSGIRIIKLKHALKSYHDECGGYFGVKFISREIPSDEIIRSVRKYRKTVFQSRFVLILLGITDILISHSFAKYLSDNITTDEKMICTEFLYLVLADCKVLNHTYGKLLWPHVICGKQFKTISNIKYSSVVKFVI